ncbi:glucosyltransferase [Vararia minispora EC-137]|uniref:Glucosyltransferase n=1 Tax=Vararia minispora EC-137 TaxID=1314806 RepID=A0ACB8QKZ0_9AGAM|nr:glucosyltransferase [Vararia minispora EC-137]
MLIYALFLGSSVLTLKELNTLVTEPYMDEPFHVGQVQAYCNGDWGYWDPKITTPPGLYILSVLLKTIFVVKCHLPTLRLTPLLALALMPFALSRLTAFHKRIRPPQAAFEPELDGVVIAAFPISWFFGLLYYTDVPSLLMVVLTVVFATRGRHWLAATTGAASCLFRQTNIVWTLYAYALSQLMLLRFRRAPPNGQAPAKLHDPPALTAGPADISRLLKSVPGVLPDVLSNFAPYALVLAGFVSFLYWNDGIVLGDKSNHVPAMHVPQLYYFIGFATMMGWPALLGGSGGPLKLVSEIKWRMFGTAKRTLITGLVSLVLAVTMHTFTIHHPFLLADNRHYTFYVWRRVFMLHPIVPYLFIPGYIACAWAWFLRVAQDQTLLQSLVLPVCTLPILLPTPLLEPRYFLVPYILLRSQLGVVSGWALLLEAVWYGGINAATMYVFLYLDRPGPIRFMW